VQGFSLHLRPPVEWAPPATFTEARPVVVFFGGFFYADVPHASCCFQALKLLAIRTQILPAGKSCG